MCKMSCGYKSHRLLNNFIMNLEMISRPLETDVETMLLPMQESMRPAHANMWARPDIPSATSHQLGKPLSTDRRARAWWDHGNREAVMAQLCLFADPVSEWRANTSGQHSEQRTRTEPWRPQRRDSSRDPQWDQRRHGCQERSDFEGPRPVARQIYEIINLMWFLEQSSKDLWNLTMDLWLSFPPS